MQHQTVVVKYYLDYCTSEIPAPTDALPARVNCCLIYDIFEIRYKFDGRGKWVNYCLDYGISETDSVTF